MYENKQKASYYIYIIFDKFNVNILVNFMYNIIINWLGGYDYGNLERYFKKAGADVINMDGLLFYRWQIAKNQYHLKDWRENTFLVTRTSAIMTIR